MKDCEVTGRASHVCGVYVLSKWIEVGLFGGVIAVV